MSTVIRKILAAGLATAVAVITAIAMAQQGDRMEQFRQMSQRAELEGLKDPFRGIVIGGEMQHGLFPVRATGVSTEPVREAATAFLASLNDEQRSATLYPVDDPEWRKWMNQHFYRRQGTYFKDMNEEQRQAAFALMRASLSARGMQLSRDIMRLNYTLGEMNDDNFVEYGEWLYAITVMGEPSANQPWGWQIDGHHLIVNYFVLGDQVVMSPSFFGSEPVVARSGKFAGVTILQDEQDMGLAFMRGLGPDARREATLSGVKDSNSNLGEAYHDNLDLDYTGISGAEMDDAQQSALLELIGLYVGNMDDGHAAVKMEEVAAHIDNTWFAWIGGTDDDSVYYYRILSPVVMIEFDHQLPVGLRQYYPSAPIREHIHTVIRTPNGNDYGKDLLRQHYAQHAH